MATLQQERDARERELTAQRVQLEQRAAARDAEIRKSLGLGDEDELPRVYRQELQALQQQMADLNRAIQDNSNSPAALPGRKRAGTTPFTPGTHTSDGEPYGTVPMAPARIAAQPGGNILGTVPMEPAANVQESLRAWDPRAANMDIPQLLASFTPQQLATLPQDVLEVFPNEALLQIASSGTSDPGAFLMGFRNERLASFDPAVLAPFRNPITSAGGQVITNSVTSPTIRDGITYRPPGAGEMVAPSSINNPRGDWVGSPGDTGPTGNPNTPVNPNVGVNDGPYPGGVVQEKVYNPTYPGGPQGPAPADVFPGGDAANLPSGSMWNPSTGQIETPGAVPMAPASPLAQVPMERPAGWEMPRLGALPELTGDTALDIFRSGTRTAPSRLSQVPMDTTGIVPMEDGSGGRSRVMGLANPYPWADPAQTTDMPGKDTTGLRKFDHTGQDIAMPAGAPVPVARPGRVIHAGPAGDFGITVVVQHQDGTRTQYSDLGRATVRVGDVLTNEPVGLVGSSGVGTGAHLHFEDNPPGAGIGYRADGTSAYPIEGEGGPVFDPTTGTFTFPGGGNDPSAGLDPTTGLDARPAGPVGAIPGAGGGAATPPATGGTPAGGGLPPAMPGYAWTWKYDSATRGLVPVQEKVTPGGPAPYGYVVGPDGNLVRDVRIPAATAGGTSDPAKTAADIRLIEAQIANYQRLADQGDREALVALETLQLRRDELIQKAGEFQYGQQKDVRDFENAEAWRRANFNEGQRQYDATATGRVGGQNTLGRDTFEANATGYYGGGPTLEREQAVANQELAYAKFQVERANQAAQIALRMGDQAEAKRQFDLSDAYRNKQLVLETKIQTGRLDLDTELGRGKLGLDKRGQDLQEQKFAYEKSQNPFSFMERLYNARGQTPGSSSLSQVPMEQGAPRRLTTGELVGFEGTPTAIKSAFASNVDQAPRTGIAQVPMERDEPLPYLSAQDANRMLPSERKVMDTVITASGQAPEDYWETSRRLSQTTEPPSVRYARTQAQRQRYI